MLIQEKLVPVAYPIVESLAYRGKYVDNGHLSNVSPGCPVIMFGEQYALVESAYIAAKNPDFVVVRNLDDSTTQTLPFSKAVRQHESSYWLSGLKRLGEKEILTKTEIIPRITAVTAEDELRSMQKHLIEIIAYLREHVQSEPLIRLESD